MPPRPLPKPVWYIGWVSFLTDTATEAIYPLLPLFLSRVLGASALSLGLIEGAADGVSSVLKLLSGTLSDRLKVQRPLVLAGYALSSAIRPFIALATAWPQVFLLRFIDRIGKGIRGAPRDAMLARFAPPDQRGRVFGFHRAMDHAGAVAGPLLAALFLFFYPEQYRTLFALTIVPGALAVALVLALPRDEARADIAAKPGVPLTLAGWSELPSRLRRLLIVILVFTLGNSTDAFLLLQLGEHGLAPLWLPVIWAAQHIVKSSTSVWGGALSDRIGRTRLIVTGWILYACVYIGFALLTSLSLTVALFLVYGVYYGLTEGAEKALIADMAPPDRRGSAFGVYNALLGIGALVASVVFGLVWTYIAPAAAFTMGAALAFAAAVLLPMIGGSKEG